VYHVDSGHHLEQFAGDMIGRSAAHGRIIDSARIGLCICYQFGNGFHRDRGIHLDDEGRADNACDWSDVAEKIEIELVIESCAGCVAAVDQQERVAICWRPHYGFGSDIACGTSPVLDDERLPESLR